MLSKRKREPENAHLANAYKRFRNKVTSEIRKSKKEYYKDYFNNNLSNMKKTWEGIKQIINNNKSKTNVIQLNYSGKPLNSDIDMANAYDNFFTKIGPDLDKQIPKLKGNKTP